MTLKVIQQVPGRLASIVTLDENADPICEQNVGKVTVVMTYRNRLMEVCSPQHVVAVLAVLLKSPIPDYMLAWKYLDTVGDELTHHDFLRRPVPFCKCTVCCTLHDDLLVDGHLCTEKSEWMNGFPELSRVKKALQKGGLNLVLVRLLNWQELHDEYVTLAGLFLHF
jgi:hypothetical protein